MQVNNRTSSLRRLRRALPAAAGLLASVALLASLGPAGLAQPPAAPAPAAPRVLVSDVLITGNRHVPSENIKNLMKTRVGLPYDPGVLQEDMRALYGTRQFANAYADTQPDGEGKVKVFVRIKDYPSLVERVSYPGCNHLSKDELDQLTGVRVNMPCNPIANKVACRRIVQRLNEDGRLFASCELLKGDQLGDREVVFNISEGPKVKVRKISFEGNSWASSAQLKTHIQSSSQFLGVFGGTYNPAMLDHDTHELVKYYKSYGFHKVRIDRELRHAPGGTVDVTFHIHEGVRYRVAATPEYHGVKSVPHEALAAMGQLKANDFYDEGKILGDVARVKDYIGYTGRNAQVQAVPVFLEDRPGMVQVRYQVEEQPRALVGQVIIVGNDRTRDNVILRQVPLFPGQVLTFPDVKQAERNLARLGIFETSPDGSVRPTVSVMDNPLNRDSPFKDILINVQETSTGSLMFGVGVNSDSGLTGSIVLNERNFDLFRLPSSFEDFLNGTAFRGAGQEFRLEAMPGTQVQRYQATFREPFLLDSPYSLTLSGYYFERFFNEYSEERLGGRVTLGRKLNDYWSVLGTARLENVNVTSVAFGAPFDYTSVQGNNLLAGFRVGVNRDSRDSILRPTEGSIFDLSFEQVIGDRNFPLINAEFTKYWTLFQRGDSTGRQVLSFHQQVGWAGTNTPVFERYFAGGFRSLRGFQFRGVSPDVNGFKVGGDWLALTSLEYQVPVTASDQVHLVGFVDSGTVSPRIDDWNTYRVSAGFGVRFVVPMLGPVPIALDLGFPIVSGRRDEKQVLAFFVGLTR